MSTVKAGADKRLMYEHGTLRWRPSANTLYVTAKLNLIAWQQNNRTKTARAKAKRDGAKAASQGKMSKTAFLIQHIAGAARTSDVLRAAIKGIEDGQKSKSVETLTVYQDRVSLNDALQIAIRNGD